jgi:hypothetical protein
MGRNDICCVSKTAQYDIQRYLMLIRETQIMTHQLTIDQKYCRGDDLCHACSAVLPGLYEHCLEHGRLLLSGPSTGEYGGLISRLIACCPDRAIVINPVE